MRVGYEMVVANEARSTELAIECFYPCGHHLCKCIGTKESVCIRKEFNSQRTGLGHQHGRRFIVLGHQYGRHDVMWKHSVECFHSRGQHLCKFIGTKESIYIRGPEDWFGTRTWPPFHCFGTPIWPPWRLVKTLYNHLISNNHEWINCSIKNAHKMSMNLPYFILSEQTGKEKGLPLLTCHTSMKTVNARTDWMNGRSSWEFHISHDASRLIFVFSSPRK